MNISLIGEINSEYKETALDHQIADIVARIITDEKEKLLKTLKIWGSKM